VEPAHGDEPAHAHPTGHDHDHAGPAHHHDHDHDQADEPGHTHAQAAASHDHDHDQADEPGHTHAQAAASHDHDHAHDHHRLGRLASLVDRVIGHSHDPADSLDDALTSDARGIRALKLSLVALGVTAALQLVVVLMSSSVALFADTVHNVADALTAVPLWVAFTIGSRAATRRYTFGYRRAEDLAGLFVLLMILLSAVLAGWESLNRLLDPQPMTNILAVIAAGLIGLAGNELVAWYRIRVGRDIGSAALVADGYHARTDGLTSLAVVIGAIGVAAGYPIADPIVGLLITAVILVVLKQATSQMLGRLMDAVEPELVDQVEAVTRAVPGVQDIGPVRLRWVGHALEATLSVTVDCELTVAQGHDVAEEVRHHLLHQVRRLDSVLIHVDPCDHDGADPHAATRHHERDVRPLAAGRT
jgi:cation diffusion facilitator family transporter